MPGNASIKVIKEAEKTAAMIREAAISDAKKLVADATADAEKRYAAAQTQAVSDRNSAIAAIKEKADAALNEERKDAVFEAERLTNRAVRYREPAVRFICLELGEKWQS